MRLTAQEEYGLRCLLQVGREWPGGSLTIPEVGRREGMTPPHAAKILQVLRRAGFLHSTRGQTGGYALANPPRQIMVKDVLAALGRRGFDEQFCPDLHGREHLCAHATNCSIRALWRRVQGAIDGLLGQTSLHDLLRREPEMTGWLHQLPSASSSPPPNPTI